MSPPIDMLNKAKEIMKHAYSPYSKFSVGACLRSWDNALFVGCNVENVSFSLTLCAEAGALAALIAKGYKEIKEVLIISSANNFCPPCGACRQRFNEFALPEMQVHLCTLTGAHKILTQNELLPYPFNTILLESP